MRVSPGYIAGLPCALAALAAPAGAEVAEASPNGFTVRQEASVTAAPEIAWAALVQPARYWSADHTWFGDAAALTMEPRAGGCFCERPGDGREAQHARVVLASPGAMLRMKGALGPLQAEALEGTLTITLEPVDGGTRIAWEYVVGGHARFALDQIAPAVDAVLAEQLSRLVDSLGRQAD